MIRPTTLGFPQFLRYLTTCPAPRDVLTALHHGPLASFGIRATFMWQVRGEELVALATLGHTRAEAERYAVLPLSLDFRLSRAVREQTVIVSNTVPPTAPGPFHSMDEDIWSALLLRVQASATLRIPIVHGGRSVGAIGAMLGLPWHQDETAQALLDSLSMALGLWLTHPASGIAEATPPRQLREWSLSFTERQRQILRLADEGLSNPAIATALNVSASTVKQDLQRCMRALRSDDRQAAVARARDLGLL